MNTIEQVSNLFFITKDFLLNITLIDLKKGVNSKLEQCNILKYITQKSLKEAKYIIDYGRKLNNFTLAKIKTLDIIIVENNKRNTKLIDLIKDHINDYTFIIVTTDVTLNTKDVDMEFIQIVNTNDYDEE